MAKTYIAKVTSSFFSSTLLSVESRIESMDIETDLDQGGRCQVVFEPAVAISLREFNGVEIVEVTNTYEKTVFKGYAHSFKYTLDRGLTMVECLLKNGKELLKTKANITARSYSNQSALTALTDCVNSWNSRSGETWTVSCPATNITLSFADGQSLYEVANQIADALKIPWTVSGTQIIIASIPGVDRSSNLSENYAEARYNPNDQRGSNLVSIERETYSTIANDVTGAGSDASVNVQDASSIATYGRSFLLVSDTTQPSAQIANGRLERYKSPQYNYRVGLIDGTLLLVSVGDKINLLIEETVVFDFTGGALVTSEKVTVEGGLVKRTLEIATQVVRKDDLVSKLRALPTEK